MNCNRSNIPRRFSVSGLAYVRGSDLDPNLHAVRGFTPERDLRAIHTKHLGVAARRGPPCYNSGAGEETKFHKPASVFAGQIDAAKNSRLAAAQIS
jgi:hypothetical protein